MPVIHPCARPICQTIIDNLPHWKKTILDAVDKTYGKSPFYDQLIDNFYEYINAPTVLLETLNMQTTLWLAGLLDMSPKLLQTREHYHTFSRTQLVDAVCQRFSGEAIEPVLSDMLTEDVEEDLSVLDTLFNIGPVETRRVLINDGGSSSPYRRSDNRRTDGQMGPGSVAIPVPAATTDSNA